MKKLLSLLTVNCSLLTVICSLLTLQSCIEPPLKLPAQEVIVDLPVVITDIDVVWNLDLEWRHKWYYGWDDIDSALWGPISYPDPTNFEVRRYYLGNEPVRPHTNVDAFTIFGKRFRRNYQFGYYDMLLWSNIDSEDGTQVLKVDDSDIDVVTATTSVTKGFTRIYNNAAGESGSNSTNAVTGIFNQPEIFYSAYPQDVYISRNKEDYDYYDEEEKCWVKHLDCTLSPLVYIYLVQVIFINNDGRVAGASGNAALTAFAQSTNVNTGHTFNDPVMVFYNTRFKKNLDYEGQPCDIIGGKFTTFGLCDMEPYTRSGHIYEGSRTDLSNYLMVDVMFSNGAEETLQFNVTDQCREQAHGGVITVVIDCNTLPVPDGPGGVSSSLFVPTVEDYDEVFYDIPM